MTTNPILVAISLNTLFPEVEDYWLPILPTVKTIDDLKRHILTTESNGRSIGEFPDDIGLYLENALLRDNTSIDCLRDRDYIEIRAKPVAKRRISSSADNTSDRKRHKNSAPECVTIDESDEESVGNGSAKTTGYTAEDFGKRSESHSFGPIDSQSQVSGGRNPSVDSSASFATNYSVITSTAQLADKVVAKADTEWQSDAFTRFRSRFNDTSTGSQLFSQPVASDCRSAPHSSTPLPTNWPQIRYTTPFGLSKNDSQWRDFTPIDTTVWSRSEPLFTASIKTIDDIRGHIPTNERIDNSDHYMPANSSADNTSPATHECITVDDSDDESMNGRSGDQTIVDMDYQLKALMSDIISKVESHLSDPTDSSTSIANTLTIESDGKCETGVESDDKSVDNKSQDIAAKNVVLENESNGSVDCSFNTTASISSAAVVTQSGDECNIRCVAMETIAPEVGLRPIPAPVCLQPIPGHLYELDCDHRYSEPLDVLHTCFKCETCGAIYLL
ncbi:unnamed protein product [Medioppia subpectinata]|uniref:Uncharacterized protein n=1 Tax=Medioppia subpectinata TaxID=1979941 RepID=A0A7R9KDD3_9ACAR|nr:unnamed protein product [Medioppia subpectinata]CAG2101194.1 unnamed protein product [Medioppia subpectinata]